MRLTVSATALGLATALLSGCGSDGAPPQSPGETAQAAQPASTPPASAPASPEPEPEPEGGLAGNWKPINESPITTLTITGNTVRTSGRLACPGTVTGATTAKPVLTLKCATENADRKRGTLKLKPDGSALVINWDGPAWGGLIDSLKRTG